MPLSPPISRRALRHTRARNVPVFRHDDGGWHIDAGSSDHDTVDFEPAADALPAGFPLHDLHLRLTIDADNSIVEADLASDADRLAGSCNRATALMPPLARPDLPTGIAGKTGHGMARSSAWSALTELAPVPPAAVTTATVGDVRRPGNGNSLPLFFPQY